MDEGRPRFETDRRERDELATRLFAVTEGTSTLDVLNGQIQTIRSVTNRDKLGHVGPVADAWAVAREASQARRATA